MLLRLLSLAALSATAACAQAVQSGIEPTAPTTVQNSVIQANPHPDDAPARPTRRSRLDDAPGIPVVPLTPGAGYQLIPFATPPTLAPGVIKLAELEGAFEDAVTTGGGKAFATFFAPDAVILNNGKPAILGRGAITAAATWNPATYQLTWTVEGAQMGPSGDMGFTWGRYLGKTLHPGSKPVTTTGRFITIWRRQQDGTWKVAMDASATAP